MTITLCGFPLSNYHNKVKLALLEKGVPFEERIVKTGQGVDAAMLAASPLGKVPYLLTPRGLGLVHSQDMHRAAERVASGEWQPQSVARADLPARFGFQRVPA